MKVRTTVAAGALAVLLNSAAAGAMTMEVRGDQLIASGRIVPDDGDRFRKLVDANPNVKTVVLWNSPGGSARANDAIAEAIESLGLNTVVTGFCVSACAMVFLAGKDRSFGDLEPIASTSLGFHASYVEAISPPTGALRHSRRASSIERGERSIRRWSTAGCTSPTNGIRFDFATGATRRERRHR